MFQAHSDPALGVRQVGAADTANQFAGPRKLPIIGAMSEELTTLAILITLWFGSVYFAASAFMSPVGAYRAGLVATILALLAYRLIGRQPGKLLALLFLLPVTVITAGVIWHLMVALGVLALS